MNIIIIMIIIYYYCHHLFLFCCSGTKQGGVRSLGRSLGSHGGDTVLLEVGGHGGVAGQSLPRALQPSVAIYNPGAAAGFFSQQVAAGGGWWGRVQWQAFGLLPGGGEVGVLALEHTGDVVQEVTEELWDALIACEQRVGRGIKWFPRTLSVDESSISRSNVIFNHIY